MVTVGAVFPELLTVKSAETPGAPVAVSVAVMRNRTVVFGAPVATPSASEFQTNVWAVPPGADARPMRPSPPGPAVAAAKDAPPLVENSTTIVHWLLCVSVRL